MLLLEWLVYLTIVIKVMNLLTFEASGFLELYICNICIFQM